MSISAVTDLERAPHHPLLLRFAVAAAGAALADWLFFGWDVGISLALFYGALGIAAIACNRIHAAYPVQIVMTLVFVAGLAAPIEDINLLSVIVATLSTAMFVIVMTAQETSSWHQNLFDATTVPLMGPFQVLWDIAGALSHMKPRTSGWLGSLVAWIVPVSIFAIFLSLLSSANPLIEDGLKRIDPITLFEGDHSWRPAFWIVVVCAIWPLLHRRIKARRPARQAKPEIADTGPSDLPSDIGDLLGAQAMTRSLILFNALFGLQTVLDLIYLWGGASLPAGMSHAEYAHRGAYPLIATALLAAAFVLIAMRPKGPSENSRLIRPLVLAWVGQNILLVISSIFRLDLYIATFSLTYLRLAAFIWMALVAIGLVLILIQIVRRKSNSWLLSANAISLTLVLYGCCFLNAPWLVAHYNVEHCREVDGKGPTLDAWYLLSLGSAHILPPLDARMSQLPELQFPTQFGSSVASQMTAYRDDFAPPNNWRAWTFRRWRLERYFANTPTRSPNPSNNNSDNG